LVRIRIRTRTQKQLETQRVMRSLYIPLPLAEQIDETSEQYGLSANKLISLLVIAGLNDDKILNTVVKGFTVSHQQTPAPVVEEPELTFSEERSEP
jgi:hypothetical protein